jgi:photosystem II stability/assembly factor-like uncharacterized protein
MRSEFDMANFAIKWETFTTHFKNNSMTKHLPKAFLLLFFLIQSNLTNAQEWIRQHPNLDLKQMNDISVGADGFGYAVGNGMFYYTSDGGTNWLKHESNLSPFTNWKYIFYKDGSLGNIAFVGSNTTHMTTNGGDTWQQLDLGENNTSVREMAFFDEGVILLMGFNKVLRSTDNGDSWSLVLEPSANANSMSFPEDDNGWIGTDDGNIYQSQDGGMTWNPIAGTPFTDKVQIDFVNNSLGYACEGKNIFKTDNGGTDWSLIADNAISSHPVDFAAAGGDNLFATKGFRINYSTDGGVTWDYTGGVSYGYSMQNIHTLPDGQSWVGGTYGAIIYTEDAALDWEDQLEGVKDKLRFIKFFDRDVGLAGGGDWALIRTTNGGNDWEDITFPHDDFDNFNDALLLSETEYLLAGRGTIYHTLDGGDTWSEVLSDLGNAIYKLIQTENGNIFAAVQNGKIYRSTDNGMNWSAVYEVPGFEWINSIDFVSDMIGYASGREGLIVKTEDGGETWTEQESGSDKNLVDIAFFNENTGFAAIDNWSDSLLYTQDGGLSWSSIMMPSTGVYRNFCFVNDSVGYVATGAAVSGALFQTFDKGQNWELVHNSSLAFYDIEYHFDGEYDHLWVCGDGGLVEYWTNTIVGITEYDFEIEKLVLFPNPSDGNTFQVKWPGQENSQLLMECYNASGQLILTQTVLKNESMVKLQKALPQGNYLIKMTDIANKKIYFETLSVIR